MKDTVASIKEQRSVKVVDYRPILFNKGDKDGNDSVFMKLEYAPKKLRSVKVSDMKDLGL